MTLTTPIRGYFVIQKLTLTYSTCTQNVATFAGHVTLTTPLLGKIRT